MNNSLTVQAQKVYENSEKKVNEIIQRKQLNPAAAEIVNATFKKASKSVLKSMLFVSKVIKNDALPMVDATSVETKTMEEFRRQLTLAITLAEKKAECMILK